MLNRLASINVLTVNSPTKAPKQVPSSRQGHCRSAEGLSIRPPLFLLPARSPTHHPLHHPPPTAPWRIRLVAPCEGWCLRAGLVLVIVCAKVTAPPPVCISSACLLVCSTRGAPPPLEAVLLLLLLPPGLLLLLLPQLHVATSLLLE